MSQTMNDTPQNRDNYQARKEPLSPLAVLLLLGLFTTLFLIFGVPILDKVFEHLGGR